MLVILGLSLASLVVSQCATSIASAKEVGALKHRGPVINPTCKNVTPVGPALDPTLDRDSCGSTAWGDRVLWVCRDTSNVEPDGTHKGFFDNSASYQNMTAKGPPFTPIPPSGEVADNAGFTKELLLYGNNNGKPFYVQSTDPCGTAPGATCSNTTRFPHWPDSPPLVTNVDEKSGNITAYTWIKNAEIRGPNGTSNNPSTALYKVTWSPAVQGLYSDVLPATQQIDYTFYKENQFAWGAAGNLIANGTAYLWGQAYKSNMTSLARVPVSGIEDISQYEYYVNNKWTRQQPASINTPGATIACTLGNQGTFYYSEPWSAYVWIGGGDEIGGKFYISLAPLPEGPWTQAEYFFHAPPGNATSLPEYSFQAHPDLIVDKTSTDIYISYTKVQSNGYQNPLYLVTWES